MAEKVSVPAPTLLDRTIGYVSPERALRRYRARVSFSALTTFARGAGGYDGAKSSRRSMRGWNPLARSADRDTVPDLEDLRARSRDLERNAPLAGGAINTATTSIIGPGLRHQAQIDRAALGLSEQAARDWERRAEKLFALWCKRCDVTRTQDFAGLQDLTFRSMLGSGDVFVVRRMLERVADPLGTRLQVIEADRVCTPYGQELSTRVIDGVELDANGAPVRYHVRNRHPNDLDWVDYGQPEWTTVPAFSRVNGGERRTLHLFSRRRPGQHRGVPYLAPVIETLKQLDRYTDAELMAAVVSGFYTIVIQSELSQGLANQEDDPDVGIVNPKLGKNEVALDYGAVLNLNPGETANSFNPSRPNTAFDPFVVAVLRQVGVALEMPFEILIKHFTASYSASRAALLEAWRFFISRREWFAKEMCQPVYEWVLTEAVARELIEARGFLEDPLVRMAWCGSSWIGRPQGTLDPTKEVAAAVERRNHRISTLAEITTELTGRDWEQNVAQLAREEATLRDAGLLPPPTAPPASPAPPSGPDAASADREDLEDGDGERPDDESEVDEDA